MTQMVDVANAENFTNGERWAWAQFLLSLMSRMPADLRYVKKNLREDWVEAMPGLEERYQQSRSPDDPTTFREYLDTVSDGFFEEGALRILEQIIANQNASRAMLSMHWSVLMADRAENPLLTSDRPIIYTMNFFGNDAHIVLPISPTRIFVAVRERTFARAMKQKGQRELVRILNRHVTGNADEFVYGIDDSQLRFVQNRMSGERVPTLLESIHQHRLASAKRALVAG